MAEVRADVAEALKAILECPVVEEILYSDPRCAVAPQGAKSVIEQWAGHGALVRWARRGDKGKMNALISAVAAAGRWTVDLALPPRCPSCGVITGEPDSFCVSCWRAVDWLGESGCTTCGLPLAATDMETCAACLAKPPVIARTRAAVAYGEATRSLPLRLKYSRKVALARTMALYMRPLLGELDGAVLVPVPLHRGRLWSRGFNQAALLAGELSRQSGLSHDSFVLRRKKRTSALKGMSANQRRKEVSGAFAIGDKSVVEDRAVILVDDVLTTGSTTDACARVLHRAGARRVELICWARVVRPAQLVR